MCFPTKYHIRKLICAAHQRLNMCELFFNAYARVVQILVTDTKSISDYYGSILALSHQRFLDNTDFMVQLKGSDKWL